MCSSDLKDVCKDAHLKVILETGALKTGTNIKKASILSMYSGADFIKTSTGKLEPAATPEAAYVMCQAIKEYYDLTGIKIGFKPAGGVSTVHDALIYYTIVKDILSANQCMAERNRGYFDAKNIFAVNMVSSPGSGKTTILEQTIDRLKEKVSITVIEGDQQTTNDADRIKSTGVPAVQINTQNGCHLEANMIHNAVKDLSPKDSSLLFIENVGNLVCPAVFDLGEEVRVVVVSVTEGDDKPLKYPYMFQSAQVCIINKIDLAPYLKSDIARLKENILTVNHHLRIFEVSAQDGTGFDEWCDYLQGNIVKQ